MGDELPARPDGGCPRHGDVDGALYNAWWCGVVDYPAQIEWFRPHLHRLCDGGKVQAVDGRPVRQPEDWHSTWSLAKSGEKVAVKCGNGQEHAATATGRVTSWLDRIVSLSGYLASWIVMTRMRPEMGGLPGLLVLAGLS